MNCAYCKIDTEIGQYCIDGDFICEDCIAEMIGDDDE